MCVDALDMCPQPFSSGSNQERPVRGGRVGGRVCFVLVVFSAVGRLYNVFFLIQ